MENNELLEPFSRMLEDLMPLETVRAVESGASPTDAWNVIEESGFLDALVPEAAGGAGLPLALVGPLLQTIGYYAVPLPLGETMLARWLIADAGLACPSGSIALVTGGVVPLGLVADNFLCADDAGLFLVSAAKASPRSTGAHSNIAATVAVSRDAADMSLPQSAEALRCAAALVHAASIAGAASRLLDMTITYANERVQFGKPIGRQQALQQSLAVMAEDVVASRIAVELACAQDLPLRLATVACAKAQTSAVAARIANTAHAVLGAIGISEEHDLQLFSRRLHASRLAAGSETYWNRLLGEALIASSGSAIDWMRGDVFMEQAS